MDQRKFFILGAILRSYIENGDPIGSRTLQRDYRMEVSPATIRNEMSDLEHLGYLMKAHTSSGRIPSDQAYRWYVDELMKRGTDEDGFPELGSQSLLKQSNALDTVLGNALKILSDATNQVAFALVPGRGEDGLLKIRFLPLSSHELVIVTVYRSKFIQTDLVHLTGSYSEDRLLRAGAIFQELLEGHRLKEVFSFLNADFFSNQYSAGNVLSELVPVIRGLIEKSVAPGLKLEGLNRLYQGRESGDWEEITDFIRRLQTDGTLLDYLKQMNREAEVRVLIGEENELPYLKESSVVVAPYHVHGDFMGHIGILGPTRMHYRKVMSDVTKMAKYIDSIAQRM